MHRKRSKMASSLIEEVKDEYIKVIKQLQVNGIVKPIPCPHVPLPEKSQENQLKTA